jgi:hypothetical protein
MPESPGIRMQEMLAKRKLTIARDPRIAAGEPKL